MIYTVITIHRMDGFTIEADGYPHMCYIGYSIKEALRKYRDQFGLRYKHMKIDIVR